MSDVSDMSDDEKVVRRLAMFLHNEFCAEGDCRGAVDYMDSARELLPKIREFIL